MAIKLQIRKQTGNVWKHLKVDDNKNVLLSSFTARWVGDVMEFTEKSGVDNGKFNISEIGVYDDTASGTLETFVSSLSMAQRLKILGYTAFYDDADVVIADLISTDASNSIELGTDGKLFAQAAAATNGLPSGGTTGQILKKQSNTNFDANWEDESAGSGTVTSVAVSASDGIEIDSGSPITTNGTIALGINKAGLKTHLDYKEEEIKGTATYDATMTGTENLDLNAFVSHYGILTGNTTITVTNTPSSGKSFVRNLTIKSTATETLTLPVSWVVIGEYTATTDENYFTIEFSNYPTLGAKVICYINQA